MPFKIGDRVRIRDTTVKQLKLSAKVGTIVNIVHKEKDYPYLIDFNTIVLNDKTTCEFALRELEACSMLNYKGSRSGGTL